MLIASLLQIKNKSMRKLFLLSMSCIINIGLSQKISRTSDGLMNTFTFTKGYFPDEYITLSKLNPDKIINDAVYTCQFKSDSSMNISLIYPQGIIACRTGSPFTEKGNWKLNGNELYVYMEGEYLPNNTSAFEATYIVESFTNGSMKLKRKKLYQKN